MRKKFKTERLVLRPFETQDLTALVSYAGDIDVARATGQLPHPYTKTEAQSWLEFNQGESNSSSSNHIYAVATLDGNLIGCISLMPNEDGWELGYWLGQPHWHKGYMREASSALLDEARQHLAPANLCAWVFTDNPRSLALLKHLGFTVCGQSAEFCVARGHDVKAHRLSLSLEAHDA